MRTRTIVTITSRVIISRCVLHDKVGDGRSIRGRHTRSPLYFGHSSYPAMENDDASSLMKIVLERLLRQLLSGSNHGSARLEHQTNIICKSPGQSARWR